MLSQPLPRRHLLKLFAKTGALFTVSTTTGVLTGCGIENRSSSDKSPVYTTRFGNLLVLDDSHADVLFAFAQACVPSRNNEILLAGVIQRLDEELYFVSDSIRDDFLLALDVLEYLPLIYGHFSRLSKLPLARREGLLRSLQQTRIDTVSAVLNACRMAVMMMYYGNASSWAAIHYDGPFSRLPPIQSAQRLRYQQLTKAKTVIHKEVSS